MKKGTKTQQSAAVCHSSICGVSVWPLQMFAAFSSFCLHLSDSGRQANRTAAKKAPSLTRKKQPRGQTKAARWKGTSVLLSLPSELRFGLSHKDSKSGD